MLGSTTMDEIERALKTVLPGINFHALPLSVDV